MSTTSSTPTERAPVGFDPKFLRKFEEGLFISGPTARRRLLNYYVLLLLATTIATFGLLSNSPATVIGAMIVAPLMQPIMATTAAVIMGAGRQVLRSLVLVVSGIVVVVLLSLLLTAALPAVLISFETNNELASRISPGMSALLAALASGAAGAFIAAREEIADSLAGVAIAISLVPPLAVVGIALGHGHWDAALGAFLLFVTNFLAILLAGGAVFLLLGLGSLANSWRSKTAQRVGLAVIAAATLLIAVPLMATTTATVRKAIEERTTETVVTEWLADDSAQYISSSVNGGSVIVYITGPAGLRTLQPLALRLSEELSRPIIVSLRVIPSEQISIGRSGE